MKPSYTNSIFTAVLLVVTNFCFSQSGENNFNSYYLDFSNSNIVPQTPNAANFTMYGNTPVNTSSGLPSISIPIFTIEEDGVQVPITLNYYASGVKVDDLSSTVGLKWTLSVGGGVTRTVKDFSDFGDGNGDGWIRNSNNSGFEDWLATNPNFNYHNKINQGYFKSFVIDAYDLWPDDFNYNFLGYSGDFIFRPDGSILKARQEDNIDIFSATINGFTLKDPLGNTFDFSDREFNTKNTIYYTEGTQDFSTIDREDNIVGWMLSSIHTKNDKSIQFEYEAYNFENQLNRSSQRMVSAYYCEMFQSSCIAPFGCESTGGSYDRYDDMLKTTTTIEQTTNKLIRKIFTDNVEVEFFYTDGPVNGTPISGWTKRVDKIVIKDKIQNKTKEFLFTYSHFSSLSSNQNRLMLIGLREKGFDGALKPPHEFSYNNTPLPDMGSRAKDMKGFYNGKHNNPSLIPRTVFSLGRTYIYGNPNNGGFPLYHGYDKLSDRYFNEHYLKAGILEEIKYPTGGKTRFEYEVNAIGVNPHEPIIEPVALNISNGFAIYSQDPSSPYHFQWPHLYGMLISIDNVVGKLEYMSLAACPNCGDPQGTIDVPRIALYKWNGSLADSPANVNLKGDEVFGSSMEGGSYSPISPNPPLDDGIYLLQLQVTDSVYNTGEILDVNFNWFKKKTDQNGSVVYQKNYFGGLRIAELKDIDINNAVYNHKKYTYHDGIAAIYFDSNRHHKELGGQKIFSSEIIYEHGGMPSNGYSYTEVSIENQGQTNNGKTIEYYGPKWSFHNIIGGELLRSEVYDENNNIIKIDSYSYANSNPTDYTFYFKIPSLVDEITHVETVVCFSDPIYGTFSTVKYIAGYTHAIGFPHYGGGWQVLSSKKTTQFLSSDAGYQPVTTINEYDYNDELLVIYEKTDTRYTRQDDGNGTITYPLAHPNGEYVEVEYTYKSDYPGEQSLSGLPIGLPISKEVKNKGLKILGQYFEYDGLGNIKNVFQYNKGQGSNNSPLNYIPSDYEQTVSYVFQDGKPVQALQEDGVATSYIYGYNNQHPVVKLERQNYAAINPALINNIKSLTNAAVVNQTSLNNAFNTLRATYPDAMITTFIYNPLVGVTSITGPNGDSLEYVYDGFGRLESITDKEGNLVQEHQYNYGNN